LSVRTSNSERFVVLRDTFRGTKVAANQKNWRQLLTAAEVASWIMNQGSNRRNLCADRT
jgi:hypothetical protein